MLLRLVKLCAVRSRLVAVASRTHVGEVGVERACVLIGAGFLVEESRRARESL